MTFERIALVTVAVAGFAFGLIQSSHSQAPKPDFKMVSGQAAWIYDGDRVWACEFGGDPANGTYPTCRGAKMMPL